MFLKKNVKIPECLLVATVYHVLLQEVYLLGLIEYAVFKPEECKSVEN